MLNFYGRQNVKPTVLVNVFFFDIVSSQSHFFYIFVFFVISAGLEPCDPVIKSHVLYQLSYEIKNRFSLCLKI